ASRNIAACRLSGNTWLQVETDLACAVRYADAAPLGDRSMPAHQIPGLIVALGVLAGVFGVLQRVRPGVPRQRRTRSELTTDVVYWFLTPLLTNRLGRAAAVVALLPLIWLAGIPLDREHLLRGYGPVAAWPGWLQALVLLVLGDFIGYWMHRAFHHGRLW